ncbi:MAG: FAD-dependent oxidoreductase [Alistipes sp.]
MKFYKMTTMLLCLGLLSCSTVQRYDVVIVGGGTSGTAAGLQAARLGANTLIIEEFDWLGGMLTSAGVSATDGNYQLRGGLWGEFRTALATHYGSDSTLKSGWVSNVMFEPSVGNQIFKQMAACEKNLKVWYRSSASEFRKENGEWTLIVKRDGKPVQVVAKVLIDATELGDVARALEIPYDVGMDARTETNEDIAPETANDIVQDLTYVAVLKDYGHDVTIAQPEGYDPSLFACCCTNDRCVSPKEPHRMWSHEKLISYGQLPGGKYMINWPIEGNDYYVNMIDMNAEERAEAIRQAKNRTLSFIYFLQTELGFNTLGLADDEFPTEDLLPFIPYHRESRRIHGIVKFTLNDITNPYAGTLYRTAIGVGDYPVDHHHARYSGWNTLPDLYFHPIISYGLPLGVVLPEKCENFIVAEKSISVTNIVNGSTRLQPVVMQIGQAAGALAALSVTKQCTVAEVPVRTVQQTILNAGGYLLPYLDLPADDPRFNVLQRIGVTGIIKGRGAHVDWVNQTWFDAEKPITEADLRQGLHEVYPSVVLTTDQTPVDRARLTALLAEALKCPQSEMAERVNKFCATEPINNDLSHPLTRLECALLIDALADPFHQIEVDIYGNYK